MTDRPRFKLEDLSIDEGSLVDEGDNPEAHIRLFKMAPAAKAEQMALPVRTTAEILAERDFCDAFWKLRSAYVDSVHGILSMVEPAQLGGALERTTSEFTSAVGSLIASVGKLSQGFAAKLRGALDDLKVASAAGPDGGEIQKAVAALDGFAPIKNVEDNVSQKNTTPPAPKTADEILAALPEDQRAVIAAQMEASAKAAAEKARADVEAAAKDEAKVVTTDLTKRLAATEAELAKMKDEALTAQFVAKAREIGAGPVDDVAKLLKSAFARGKEEGELLERTLRGMAERVKKGQLFSVVGSESRDGATSAEDQLEAEAKKIAAEEKLPFHAAYKRACDRNVDLARKAITKSTAVGE